MKLSIRLHAAAGFNGTLLLENASQDTVNFRAVPCNPWFSYLEFPSQIIEAI
jgi:hypothetical protein